MFRVWGFRLCVCILHTRRNVLPQYTPRYGSPLYTLSFESPRGLRGTGLQGGESPSPEEVRRELSHNNPKAPKVLGPQNPRMS